jgi:hypothetical protein
MKTHGWPGAEVTLQLAGVLLGAVSKRVME